jgi:hypothetical protein
LATLPSCPEKDWLLHRAKVNEYHCFKSTLPFPKHTLVDDLRAVKQEAFDAIAAKVINGEFDDRPDEFDLQELTGLVDKVSPQLERLLALLPARVRDFVQ